MDYFVPQHKTYIKAQPGISPIDLIKWEVCVRGSGDEPQVWTSARDAAKAMVELLLALKWVCCFPVCDSMKGARTTFL